MKKTSTDEELSEANRDAEKIKALFLEVEEALKADPECYQDYLEELDKCLGTEMEPRNKEAEEAWSGPQSYEYDV